MCSAKFVKWCSHGRMRSLLCLKAVFVTSLSFWKCRTTDTLKSVMSCKNALMKPVYQTGRVKSDNFYTRTDSASFGKAGGGGGHKMSNSLYHYLYRLKDQYLQNWHERVSLNAKLVSYIGFKITYNHELYLHHITNRKYKRVIPKFRFFFCARSRNRMWQV